MITVGIDIGGHQHAVARCRSGQDQAEREVLRISQDRAGFERLDAWLARQEEPVGRITMESSGHDWMGLASHVRGGSVPVQAETARRGYSREAAASLPAIRRTSEREVPCDVPWSGLQGLE